MRVCGIRAWCEDYFVQVPLSQRFSMSTPRTVVWLYKVCIVADELEGAGDAGAKGHKVLCPCGIILRPTWGSACSIWCVKLRPLEWFEVWGER